MSLLIPNEYFNKLTDVDVDLLKKLNIKLVLLDVDNTISPPDTNEIFDGVSEWISSLKNNNIDIILVSNNYKKRVAPIAKLFDLNFYYLSLKPLPFRFLKLIKNTNINKSEILMIGDQIFSDVLFANFLGIKSLLVEPQICDKKKCTIIVRRYLERYIKSKFISKLK